MNKRRLLPWTIGVSLLLHGVAYASLASAPALPKPVHRKTLVRFEVNAQPKPQEAAPVPVTPAPPPPKPQAPIPKRKLETKSEPAPSPPPLESPASQGVTLAGDGTTNAFGMPLGNGGALQPNDVRPPAPLTVPSPVREPVAVARRAEPAVVAVGDLSTRPSPPPLASALERNYPADARVRGLSGTAKVRARIDPDGVVRRVTLLDESAAGFGSACTRTVNGSRWAPPKDKAGRPVATEIRYTCRFVIQP